MKTPTKIDHIKSLYSKVHKSNLKGFWEAVAEEFELKVSSVRIGWFFRFEVPAKYSVQEDLIAFMQNYIRNQKPEIKIEQKKNRKVLK